jgi:hypothetical protein
MNEMIENSYKHIMSQITTSKDSVYNGYTSTLYGENFDENNIKMVVVSAYLLGQRQGYSEAKTTVL